jgi:ABC-type Fe3+-siderophore transport system permease subunit
MKFQPLETAGKLGLVLAAPHLQHMHLNVGKSQHKHIWEAHVLSAQILLVMQMMSRTWICQQQVKCTHITALNL